MLIAVWLVISLAVTSANIVYPVRDETTGLIQFNRSIVIYNHLPWNRDFTVSNVALVDLFHNVSVFNYCDVNAYTSSGVERLLQAHPRRNLQLRFQQRRRSLQKSPRFPVV